jgi:hypothetical protein
MLNHAVRATLLALTILLVGAVPALAQADELLAQPDGNVLVGIGNDVALASGEEADAIFIVQGAALVEGVAKAVVAIDADVTVSGTSAAVEDIFIVGGTLTIEDGATVEEGAYANTTVTGAELVTGELRDIESDMGEVVAWGAAVLLAVLFFVFIGWLIAILVSSLLLVAFGTSQARRAAANIGGDTLKTIVAGLVMLILPAIVIGLLFVTVVGIPLAIGLALLWGVVAFLGWLVTGLWIGQAILSRSRTAARPYGAAFLGTLILILVSWIPFVGAILGFLGLGAVTLAGWRVLRSGGTPPAPAGYGGPWGSPYQVPPPPYAPPPYAQPQPPGYWPPQQGGPPASWPQG